MKPTPLAAILGLAPVVFLCSLTIATAEISIITSEPAATNRAGIAVPTPTRGTGTKPAASQDNDVLKLKNGDTLHGVLLSASPQTGLRWHRSDSKEAIVLELTNLAEVKLASRGAPAEHPKTRASIRLTNGDDLPGEVVSLNKTELVLNTWYAGQVTIKRSMVESISPNESAPSTIYSGPTSMDGWISRGNDGAWTYKKGALISQTDGYLFRDVKLPDVSRFEFDVTWKRMYPSFQFAVYSESTEDFYGNGYVFQMNGTSIYLQRGSPRRGMNNLGSPINVESLQRKSKAHLVVLANKPKKTIALLVDGELVKQWTETDEFAGRGTGIMFYGRGVEGSCRISQITVSDWDGKFDTDAPTANAGKEDLVRFANNDKVSGALEGIGHKEIAFTSSYATLKIPLERVLQISFAADKVEKARRQTNDVRAQFGDGGRITLALDKLDDKSLAGSSENCGKLTASLDAFNRIQFRIYDETSERSSDDDSGD